MTLTLLRIDNQLQCIVGLTFTTGTKDFMVTTQSTNNDQVRPSSAHPIRLITLLLKLCSRTLPQITLKVETENFERLIATDNSFPGVLHCGSAKPTT